MGLFIEFPLCDIRYYPNPPFLPGFFWEYEWWNIEVSFHQGMILFETSHRCGRTNKNPGGITTPLDVCTTDHLAEKTDWPPICTRFPTKLGVWKVTVEFWQYNDWHFWGFPRFKLVSNFSVFSGKRLLNQCRSPYFLAYPDVGQM